MYRRELHALGVSGRPEQEGPVRRAPRVEHARVDVDPVADAVDRAGGFARLARHVKRAALGARRHVLAEQVAHLGARVERLAHLVLDPRGDERGVGRVLDFLKAKYFSETNESNPAAEWDNIVRWVATDSWMEKRSSFEFLRNFAAGLDASEWGSRDVI